MIAGRLDHLRVSADGLLPHDSVPFQLFQQVILERSGVRVAMVNHVREDHGDGGVRFHLSLADVDSSVAGDVSPSTHQGMLAEDSYRLWLERQAGTQVLHVQGQSLRGLTFGIGRLLRMLRLDAGQWSINQSLPITGRPQLSLRGHQLGYRAMNNTYDAWGVPEFEKHLRDMLVFGCNAIELVAPSNDDLGLGPKPQIAPEEMFVQLSRLAANMLMEVWVWQPVLTQKTGDEKQLDAQVDRVLEDLSRLNSLQAVFVPGGDPGHLPGGPMLRVLKRMHQRLQTIHPGCTLWFSPQELSLAELHELSELLAVDTPYLTGLVYGPWVHVSLAQLRAMIPERYPIRAYPDISHTRECQFPQASWHWPFAFTEGREMVNPRPLAMQRFYDDHQAHTFGFITYSEGVHDDVNKFVWSGLAWEGATVRQVLLDYAHYFLHPDMAEAFTQTLLDLEQNWYGPITDNQTIERTLQTLDSLAGQFGANLYSPWRFQLAHFRAAFDAFTRRRFLHESQVQQHAVTCLRQASTTGSLVAMQQAQSVLQQADLNEADEALRTQCFTLGDALHDAVGIQLSVPRHGASAVLRGACLDEIDVPLNDRHWFEAEFARIRQLDDEELRVTELSRLLRRYDLPADVVYDDLGDITLECHLHHQAGLNDDPYCHVNPAMQVGLVPAGGQLMSLPTAIHKGLHPPLPLAWCRNASAMHSQPLQMRYTGLKTTGHYRLMVVYAEDQRRGPIQLTANECWLVHPYLDRRSEPLDFELPAELTAGGCLRLSFEAQQYPGQYVRRVQVAEIILEHQPT